MRPTRRDSLLVAAGAVVSGLSGFGFTWLLARATGPAGAAVVLTVTTWFTLCFTVAKFGMDTTLVREGGRLRTGGTGAGHHQLLRWTLWPVMIVAGAAGLLITAASAPIGEWILTGSPVPLAPLVVAAGLLLPLAVYTVVQLAFLRGLGMMHPYVLIEQLLKPGLRIVLPLLLIAGSVTGALELGLAWFAPVLIGGLLTFAVAREAAGGWSRGGADPGERRRVWQYSAPRAVSQIVDIVNTSFGVVVLGVLSTPAETGSFATALRVVFAGQLAFQAVRLLVAPAFAASLASKRTAQAQEIFASSSSLIVVLAWPVFLFCLTFPELVLGVFGEGFGTAAPALQVLSLSGLLMAVVGNQGSMVLMSGRSYAALWAVSGGLAVNALLTLSLFSAFGAVAAAVGWTTSIAVEGAVLAWVLRQEGFRPLPKASLLMAGRIVVTIGVGFVLARTLAPNAAVLAVTLGGVGVLAGVAWAGRSAWHEFVTLTRGEEDV